MKVIITGSRSINDAEVFRNRQMAEYASASIIIWDGKSSGSRNMIMESKRCGLKICVKII